MEAFRFIDGHERVLEAFGRWPSFHDGEIHRVVLDRMTRNPAGGYVPCLELFLRGWIMTSEVTPEGYYKTENDSVVHFVFAEVSELELDGLNHQNVISGLNLEFVGEGANRKLKVDLEHCYGLSGTFHARQAKVIGVEPFRRGDAG